MEDRFVICPVKGGPKGKEPYESIQILDTHCEDTVILEKEMTPGYEDDAGDFACILTLKDIEQIVGQLNSAYKTGFADGDADCANPF